MLTKIQWNAQHILWGLVCLIYLIFFRNFIFNSGITQPLVLFFIVILIIILSLKEKIIMHKTILGMTIFPAIFIGLNELLLKQPLTFPISNDVLFTFRYRKQFFYMLCFLALPSILFFIKFKTQHFFNILFIAILISIVFNTYLNIHLDFNRNALAQALEPVILYDYGNIALSLLVVCYSFYLKGTRSYLIIALVLFNILLIVLHGSRGAWLGLPIAFLMIFIFYWRYNVRKILIFTILPIILLIASLVLIPNSPIQQRLSSFIHDKDLITESSNYHSSIGSRLLIWKIALDKSMEAPFIGIGMAQFQENNRQLYKQGILGEPLGHAHNVYLQTLVSQGLLGLSAILFLMLAPFTFFIKQVSKQTNTRIYLLSVSGIVFISYIMICSLTDMYFLVKTTTMLYYLVIVTLISLILKEKQEHLH